MTGSSKILTVSYGTFSCTLEGFDDPFGTMRGIAEYFRDLAADDRYFGAEPPTPDVEMLQNIAQKEVSRRVEARIGETGVALRQVTEAPEATDAPSVPVAEAAPPAPKPAPAKPAPAAKVEEAELLDSGPLAFDDEYLMADEPEDVFTVDTNAEPIKDTSPPETVAEKLRRIRAVVSKSIEAKEQQQPFSPAPAEADDAGADAKETKKRSRALTETIASITADLADEFEAEEGDDLPAAKGEPTAIANVASDADDADTDTDYDEDAGDNAFDAIAEPGDTADADEVAEADNDAPITDIAGDEDAPSGDAAASADDDAAIVASVGKIVASETLTDNVAKNAPEAPDQASTESAEDATAEATDRKASAPRAPLGDSNGDVGRLLKETDQKLNDGEGIRRRRVISQMRAAVAATKADRIFTKILSREVTDAKEQTPYRKDLDQVISRQPTGAPRVATANISRPAPLVLVSSQRVDIEKDKPADAEVTPQRVEKSDGDEQEVASFRDFATKMGAVDLPDLLEAAAAYSAFVEGEPHFSRPEIMKRVARVDPALELSRETGLRTFGQLLRQGKILKLQRGQFTIGEDTRFNPAQRIAGE